MKLTVNDLIKKLLTFPLNTEVCICNKNERSVKEIESIKLWDVANYKSDEYGYIKKEDVSDVKPNDILVLTMTKGNDYTIK